MVYLDHAATTATHPEVIKEMLPFFQDVYSNPSGSYEFAADSRLMLERARKVIADSIHAKPEEIFFTGSGTIFCNLFKNISIKFISKRFLQSFLLNIYNPF